MSNLSNLIQSMLVNAITKNSGQPDITTNGNSGNSNNPMSSPLNNSGGLGGLGNILSGLQNKQSSGANNTGGLGGGLGDILGSVLGGLGGNRSDANNSGSNSANTQPPSMSKQAKLLVILVPFVLAWIQKQGGFHNAIKVLTQSGMGNEAQSWVSNGINQPVDSNKISTLFNDAEIEQVANQAHISKDDVYSTIANLLPQMVDSIAANGQVQGNGSTNQIQQVMNMLGGLNF